MARPDARWRVTATTMAVLVAILLLGLVYGWRAVTAPVDDEADAGTAEPSCAATLPEGSVVRSDDITVSVLNAGSQAGMAESTLEQLADRGFGQGEAGNAPATFEVATVRVLAQAPDDPAAKLVAAQFGARTRITVSQDDLGPGVVVIVGDKRPDLARNAPEEVRARVAGSGC